MYKYRKMIDCKEVLPYDNWTLLFSPEFEKEMQEVVTTEYRDTCQIQLFFQEIKQSKGACVAVFLPPTVRHKIPSLQELEPDPETGFLVVHGPSFVTENVQLMVTILEHANPASLTTALAQTNTKRYITMMAVFAWFGFDSLRPYFDLEVCIVNSYSNVSAHAQLAMIVNQELDLKLKSHSSAEVVKHNSMLHIRPEYLFLHVLSLERYLASKKTVCTLFALEPALAEMVPAIVREPLLLAAFLSKPFILRFLGTCLPLFACFTTTTTTTPPLIDELSITRTLCCVQACITENHSTNYSEAQDILAVWTDALLQLLPRFSTPMLQILATSFFSCDHVWKAMQESCHNPERTLLKGTSSQPRACYIPVQMKCPAFSLPDDSKRSATIWTPIGSQTISFELDQKAKRLLVQTKNMLVESIVLEFGKNQKASVSAGASQRHFFIDLGKEVADAITEKNSVFILSVLLNHVVH